MAAGAEQNRLTPQGWLGLIEAFMKINRLSCLDHPIRFVHFCSLTLLIAVVRCALASENVPHRPFAQWADVPSQGQFVLGAVYQQAGADVIWASGQRHSAPEDSDSGTHLNQGYFALQYGINERWAADLSIGFTKATWQDFQGNSSESTSGLMDWSFGVRYQLCNEAWAQADWLPTATFRAGAVMPGSYSQDFPFSPGLRSAAIEPELLLRKHYGWSGFGSYGDGLFRWNRTTGNSQYLLALGFFQQIKNWELDLGWRHLQTLSGKDITFTPGNAIVYPRDPRENNDSLEAGFSYTTTERRNRYGAEVRAILDGNNTDQKFWFGFSVDLPFGGKASSASDAH